MSAVQKTITLTDQQELWIRSQVDAGRYTDDSELIRDLLRCEQERNGEVEAIRATLIEGEQSDEERVFDVSAFKQRVRAANG